MGAETITLSEKDVRRANESVRIRNLGVTAAAAMAIFYSKFARLPLDVALDKKRDMVAAFQNPQTPRKTIIESLRTVESVLTSLSNKVNPGCRETNIAYQIRRLDLISFAIRSGIAVDREIAINSVDLVLGNSQFDLNSMELVKQESCR